MRTLILLVLAAFLAVAPLSARAQTVPNPVPAPAPGAPPAASSTIFGLPPSQALAVGVGMIAGGVGMSMLSSGPFSTIVGGLAGALIGNWWYATRPMVDARGLPMRQQQLSALQ